MRVLTVEPGIEACILEKGDLTPSPLEAESIGACRNNDKSNTTKWRQFEDNLTFLWF